MNIQGIKTNLVILLAGIAIGAVGAVNLSPKPQATSETKTEERLVTKTNTRIVWKKPDGTVIESIKDKQDMRHKDASRKEEKIVTAVQARPNFRVGILFPIGELSEPTVMVGRRLVGDVWGDISFNTKHKEITVGGGYVW